MMHTNENDSDIERGIAASEAASATSTNATQLQAESVPATTTTADIIISAINNQNQQPDAAALGCIQTTTTTTTPFLHTIEDDLDELPLPIGMAETISNVTEPPKQIGKVELIDDNAGPVLPPGMAETISNVT